MSRDTLSDLESGTKDYRRLTLSKVQKALDELETEAGITAPMVESTEQGLIEFEVSGDFGVHVVVKGPISDADALERAVARLVRDIRTTPEGDD